MEAHELLSRSEEFERALQAIGQLRATRLRSFMDSDQFSRLDLVHVHIAEIRCQTGTVHRHIIGLGDVGVSLQNLSIAIGPLQRDRLPN
jgi:hypothetical protein